MKRTRTPPTFSSRTLIYYPAIPRHRPTRTSALTKFAAELAQMRADGRSITELREWIHQRTAWRPCERVVYQALSRLKRSVK